MSTELKAADFEPPAAQVMKIIKSVLPENVVVAKSARAAIARAAGIFIFYITHGANDFSRESKRSTIYTQDILNSLKYVLSFLSSLFHQLLELVVMTLRELGFEDFEASLDEFLEAYRKETEEQKMSASLNKMANETSDPNMDIVSSPYFLVEVEKC